MQETVSDEARKDQWGVRSIDKVQHAEKKTSSETHVALIDLVEN